MGARNSDSSKRKNYYSIAFGYLSTMTNDEPLPGMVKTTTSELKSRMDKHENIDLRNTFVLKDGEYPYQMFYQKIKGHVLDIEKEQTEKYGILLKITLLDEDNETSFISMKFYSKYAENFLNRFAAVDTDLITLAPYSIPGIHENKSYYNQGIVIYKDNEKIMPLFSSEELPSIEEIIKEDGTTGFSRVKRISYIWNTILPKIEQLKSIPSVVVEGTDTDINDDDLPF